MTLRTVCALVGLLLLIGAAAASSLFLRASVDRMDAALARAETAFSAGNAEEGKKATDAFAEELSRRRFLLAIFAGDADLHAVDRGLVRAARLAEEGEFSLARAEVSDLRETLRDMMRYADLSPEYLL